MKLSMKNMMMFIVSMSSVLFTLASEINNDAFDFDVYSWVDGKELIIEDTLELKRTGLRRRLQSDDLSRDSSDDGPHLEVLYVWVPIVALVAIGVCAFWYVILRKETQDLPEPEPKQVFPVGVLNV